MTTRTDTTRETVNETTSEAIRTASEASRRTLQSAQDSMQTARAYLEESIEANRKLFNAYAQGIEAAIKGGFEVQNAVLAAGRSFLDASANSNHNVAQQWTEIAHEAQNATLDLWQAGVGAGDKMLGQQRETAAQAGREETRQRR